MCYPPSQCLTLAPNEMVIGLPQHVTLQVNVLPSHWDGDRLPPQCVTLPVSVLPSHWDGDWSSTSMCYPPSQYLTLPARRQPQELVPQGTQCWCGWQQTPSPLCWQHSRSGESANTSTAVSLVWLLLNSLLSLKMVCMCSGKPIIMNSTSSLRRPPSVYIIGFQCWSDRWWPFFLLGRLLSTSSVYASLLQVVEGVSFFFGSVPTCRVFLNTSYHPGHEPLVRVALPVSLKLFNTSDHPGYEPFLRVASPISQAAWSLSLTPAFPGQWINASLMNSIFV